MGILRLHGWRQYICDELTDDLNEMKMANSELEIVALTDKINDDDSRIPCDETQPSRVQFN